MVLVLSHPLGVVFLGLPVSVKLVACVRVAIGVFSRWSILLCTWHVTIILRA